MTTHRHPRCITPANGQAAAPASDIGATDALRAELETERQRVRDLTDKLQLERARSDELARECNELHQYIAAIERGR